MATEGLAEKFLIQICKQGEAERRVIMSGEVDAFAVKRAIKGKYSLQHNQPLILNTKDTLPFELSASSIPPKVQIRILHVTFTHGQI